MATQKEMMPRILRTLLDSDRGMNIFDIRQKCKFKYDELARCLTKMESFGLVEFLPSGFGISTITVIMLPKSLKSPSLV